MSPPALPCPGEPQATPFQVDLRGVVDLLSRHIYSGPRVYLRELLQNGVDAITARRELDPGAPAGTEWSIRLTPFTPGSGEFRLEDQGIGLTRAEAAELLSTVGATSKRDILDFPRQDFLGQFGIGLLSCFMVADEIRVVTRSAKGGPAVEWLGSAEGTFTIRELPDAVPVGTAVHLRPRFDGAELLGPAAVAELASQFGRYLPVPVKVGAAGGGEAVNEPAIFAERDVPAAAALAFGRELLGADALDWFPLDCPETGSRGMAFVLPFAPPPGARQATQLYLGRMLVSTQVDGMLPDWAFFIRACVNSTGLTPTASREAIVEDFSLEVTRQAFGQAARQWLVRAATTNPHLLERFLAVHERAIKQLVPHDPELAKVVAKHLSLETSAGRRTVSQLAEEHKLVRYTETVDEFRQVVGICGDRGVIVNGGYLWDAELTRLLPELYGTEVERVDVLAELDTLDAPPLADRARAAAFEQRATASLDGRDCEVVARLIGDGTVPALFVADPELFRRIDRSRAGGAAGPLWRGVLGRAGEVVSAQPRWADGRAASRLCLNWRNRLIQTLVALEDQPVFERCVRLLYAQAQLAGHRPLSARDRKLVDTAVADLIALSAGVADTPPPNPNPNP
ncbi:MAG: HSP90 family protein [Propionibacteriaceae bacterium]|nr:HSP90 family protein [Propionibacteriaceae bacterium]